VSEPEEQPLKLILARNLISIISLGAFLVDAVIASGVPAEYGEMLTVLTETIASGSGSRHNDDVHRVTGTSPTSFADFAQRTASAWANEVAG
jgi:hypothetical protein